MGTSLSSRKLLELDRRALVVFSHAPAACVDRFPASHILLVLLVVPCFDTPICRVEPCAVANADDAFARTICQSPAKILIVSMLVHPSSKESKLPASRLQIRPDPDLHRLSLRCPSPQFLCSLSYPHDHHIDLHPERDPGYAREIPNARHDE